MIRIVKGTYGYREGNKIIPKTKKDGPLQLDKYTEKRLVENGIAKYVTSPELTATHTEPSEMIEQQEEVIPDNNNISFENMSVAELKEVASQYGIDVSKINSKNKIISAIEEYIETDEPNLTVEGPE